MLGISFATATVTVVRPRLVTDHGAQVPDWTTPDKHDVPGCTVEPLGSQEIAENRDLTLGARRIHAPHDADVRAGDRLELPGERGRFAVVGEPSPWPSPTGSLSHLEILANRWTEGRRP